MSAPDSQIHFPGLRATPAASYLSAIAVQRIASSRWPNARGAWRGDRLVLEGPFTRHDLVHHLVTVYAPTPVASPWNAGSGFYSPDQTLIETLESSTDDRLQDYRAMLAVIRRHTQPQPPAGEAKTRLLQALYRDYPPAARLWLEAVVDLSQEPPRYSSLLFTGGNDGKLDFARNTLEAVADLLLVKPPQQSRHLLEAHLDDRDDVPLPSQSLGAYDPSTVKGYDGLTVPRSNPWAQLLLIEGLLALNGLSQRRPHQPHGQPSLHPGEATGKDLYLPLWQQPATLDQLRQNPSLVTGHWRHATLPRNGRAHFIVPVAYSRKDQKPEPVLVHDGSDEFELALSLAGLGAGVNLHPNLQLPPQLDYLKGTHGMSRLLRARISAAQRISQRPNRAGIRPFNDPFWSSRPASPALIARYLQDTIDSSKVCRLVRHLPLHPPIASQQSDAQALLPYPYRLLKLAFHQHKNDRRSAPLEVLTSLARNDVDKAMQMAHRFLLPRHPHLPRPPQARGPHSKNLANALLLPISNGTYRSLLESLA